MSKFELLKKLEYLIAFQANQFLNGDWKEADLAENEIKRLEENILSLEAQ
ncbi:MAG: hypothetical protein V1804_03905 [Patescibacteria group bacterium]